MSASKSHISFLITLISASRFAVNFPTPSQKAVLEIISIQLGTKRERSTLPADLTCPLTLLKKKIKTYFSL